MVSLSVCVVFHQHADEAADGSITCDDSLVTDQSASSSLNGVIHRPQRPEDRYNPDERSYPSTAIVSSDCTHARGECRSDTDGCSSLPSSCCQVFHTPCLQCIAI